LTTKIRALTGALGNLIDLPLLPGQTHDLRGTAALTCGLSCGKLLADRAFDANWLREALAEAWVEAVIPPKSNRRLLAEFDRDTCSWRHLIEKVFGKLKEYRGYRHTLLQDRHQFQRIHRPRGNRHPTSVKISKP
jgi:transposase